MRRMVVLAAVVAHSVFAATTINVSNSVVVSSIKRFGIQMSDHTYYDRIVLKNLVWHNAGFEASQYQTLIRVASGTSTGCVDTSPSTQWPTGFWDGGTYEFVFGAAKGRSGTISTFITAPHDGMTGSTFNFEGPGTTPAAGDYFIVRKYFSGGADTGWNPFTNGGATITTETVDLPPGTDGRQCIRLTADAGGQFASINTAFGTYGGQNFILMNGNYQLTFKARGVGGGNSIQVGVARGDAQFMNQFISLTSSWANYTFNFSAAETGSPTGFVAVQFNASGSSALLDDVSLVQTNGDPANTTAFRDPVVAALQSFNPGILRGPNKEQGETLDNLTGPPFGHTRAGYSYFATSVGINQYGWQEFLELCEFIHTEPYLVIPITFSNAELANVMEYLGGPANTIYGARRAARGHPAPWTDSFRRIHIEYANEAWNPVFLGATMLAADFGVRGGEALGILKQSPYYNSSKFNLILGTQAANPFNTRTTHNASANHDMIALGPYIATTIDDFSSNEQLFGGLFAEASWWSISPNGPMKQTYDFINGTARPVPFIVYEVNLHTTRGSITQPVLDTFTPSIGAGLAVADHMLIMLREFRLRDQALFALAGYRYDRDDGKTVLLWGVTRDMGVTDRKRPQYLALKLANEAMSGDLVQTTQSGDDPHWNQPLTNNIALDNVPYIQSFAFANGDRKAVVIFNLHRTSSLQINLTGPNAPSGAVTMRTLSAANITDTNEDAGNVTISTNSFTSFDPSQTVTLPPYSMTMLIHDAPPPVPTGLQATATSTSQVSVTWNPSLGASQYELARMSNGGALQVIATAFVPWYTDSSVSTSTAYVYRVRAVASGGTSAYGNADLATTVPFTDEPIVAGTTIIRQNHLMELRTAVNAVRATASAGPQSWTEDPTVRAVHILELRSALTQALNMLTLPLPTYTNPINVGDIIRAVDFQELRNAVR